MMKVEELAAKLLEVKKTANDKYGVYDAVNVVLNIVEPQLTWFGNFEVSDVQYNQAQHRFEIICKGRNTNFLEAGRGFLEKQK